jgi:uncharacterized protein with FMN-binding domain
VRTAHRRSFALLAATAAATTLASCASSAATDTPAEGASQASAADPTASATGDAATGDGGGDAGASPTDGTYTATGGYRSPAGPEKVEVTVTLADGVVTAVEVTPLATDPTSTSFQTRFASGVADQVVGKALADVQVDKVSGSSLTSGGFMAAIEQIAAGDAG